jgi:O-antigen ligase
MNEKSSSSIKSASRWLIACFVISLGFSFDAAAYDAAASIRYYWLHLTALLLLGGFFFEKWQHSSAKQPFSISLVPNTLNLCVLITGLAAIVTSLNGISPPDHWWQLKNFLGVILLFAFVAHFYHIRWYRSLIWLIVIGAHYNALLGIFQFFAVDDAQLASWMPGVDTLHFLDHYAQAAPPAASFINKNLAASYQVLCLPLVIYLSLSSQKKQAPFLFAMLSFTLMSVFLIYTRTRASWISAFAVLVFAVIWLAINPVLRTHLKPFLSRKLFISFAIASCFIVYAGSIPGKVQGHSVKNSVAQQVANIESMFENNLEGRGYFYRNSLAMLKAHPQGIGLAGFSTLFPKYYQSVVRPNKANSYSLKSTPKYLHSDLLQAYIELGIVGGSSYLLILLSPLWIAWRLRKSQKLNSETHCLTFFLLLALGGISVNAIADFPLQKPVSASITWLLLGMLAAISLRAQTPTRSYRIRSLPVPQRLSYAILLAITVCGFLGIGYESLLRRSSSCYLLQAHHRSQQTVYDQQTLNYALKAFKLYPFNNLVLEHYANIAAHHYFEEGHHLPTSSFAQCDAILKKALKSMPYAENLLLNAGILHLGYAQSMNPSTQAEAMAVSIQQAHHYAQRALDVSDRQAKTLNLYAATLLAMHQEPAALPYFKAVLTIEPENRFAQDALNRLEKTKL